SVSISPAEVCVPPATAEYREMAPLSMHAMHPELTAEVDDDALSTATSLLSTPATGLPSRFDKADINRLRTKLQPSTVSRWCREFIETLYDYSPRASALAALSGEAATISIDADPAAAQAQVLS
ncbi:MAG: hypothetical protein ACO32I_08735, partial [Candidatus Limnocylindrus sp.]